MRTVRDDGVMKKQDLGHMLKVLSEVTEYLLQENKELRAILDSSVPDYDREKWGLAPLIVDCETCGTRYDFRKHDVCPKCGADNLPF